MHTTMTDPTTTLRPDVAALAAAVAALNVEIERLKTDNRELRLACGQALACIRIALPAATDTIAALERALGVR